MNQNKCHPAPPKDPRRVFLMWGFPSYTLSLLVSEGTERRQSSKPPALPRPEPSHYYLFYIRVGFLHYSSKGFWNYLKTDSPRPPGPA